MSIILMGGCTYDRSLLRMKSNYAVLVAMVAIHTSRVVSNKESWIIGCDHSCPCTFIFYLVVSCMVGNSTI
jgi:hypothetical protein